jgi:asparagine synthase (glutamine-hydrolysing)
LAANGEIYNHLELRKQYEGKYEFKTESDCEVILALYKEKGVDFIDDLNGIFAFAIYDSTQDSYLIARDHMGIIPLYMGWDKDGTFYIASELKALEGFCSKIELFPPGHFIKSGDSAPNRWYKREWVDFDTIKNNPTSIEDLHDALSDAFQEV